jgi:two-component system, chemotaxis family, sensor kinase CheA
VVALDDFEKELKVGFLEEAAQAIDDVEQSFLILEQNPTDKPVLDKIFRLAHNLKGSSRAVGFNEMGQFTHEFESLLLKLKEGQMQMSLPVMNLLLRCNDFLKNMVEILKQDLSAVVDSSALELEIKAAQAGELNVAAETTETTEAANEEVTAVAVNEDVPQEEVPSFEDFPEETVEAPILMEPQAEVIPLHPVQPVIPAQPQIQVQSVAPVQPKTVPASAQAPAGASSSASEDSIRISISKLEKLLNFVGEMVILNSVLREQSHHIDSLLLKKTVHQLGKVTKEVQDMSMSLRMVPIKPTFQKMNRIVRDTAGALDKKVQLILVGEDTELDKTVLEKVNDPLVHLVRNAVDHGIENKEARLQSGKSDLGTVTLKAEHRSGKLAIEIIDDGAGINPQKLFDIAVKKGLLKPTAQLTETEKLHLIFAPGFSTKSEITDISGRGVGMDVVKTNITELGGEIKIETHQGKGSVFTILLPLTMAIIDGMVVSSAGERYVIPLVHVNECIKIVPEQVKSFSGIGELLLVRGENLPLINLSGLMGKKKESVKSGIAIIVRGQGEPFAIVVDDIIGQYQVVIKQLGLELAHLKGFSGSTILGDGKPALIVEPRDLVNKNNRGISKSV